MIDMYTVLYTNTSRLKYMYRNGLKISECSFKKIFFICLFAYYLKPFDPLEKLVSHFSLQYYQQVKY